MNEAQSPEPEVPLKRRYLFERILVSFVVWVWVIIILACSAAGLIAFLIYDHVLQPGHAGPEIEVTVPEGATGNDVAVLLEEKDLIEYDGFFRLAMKIDDSGEHIRHGVYQLPKGLSALELLRLLQEGPDAAMNPNQVRITIPEGLTIRQIAAMRPEPEDFIRAASDPDRIARLGVAVESLEGFLMPDTYFFDEEPAAGELADRMLAQFQSVYAELTAAIPGAEEGNMLSVVTMASLIEEEARSDNERPLVAAVLYNRLGRGMRLQMDSTLQYALNKYGQRILYEDREVASPYNTYKNAGLPPGPISNPGRASLRAALEPADEAYLYFVSNADGRTHTFSRTAREHERAVARYRREIAVQRRKLQE
jgi:UPF0755 protein